MLIMLTEITLSACFLCVDVVIWLTVGVLPVVLPTHIQVALYRIPFAVVVVAVSTFVASGGGRVGDAVHIALLPCSAAVVQGSESKANQTMFEIHPHLIM